MKDLNRDEIFIKVQAALVELFELEADDIDLDTQLYSELDLDSLDAVDLVVHLQKITGKKIQAHDFQMVRTVEDIVDAVEELLKDKA